MPEQLSDAILLERFVSRREEAAFVALVERHGPLVQRVCRRILRNEHDVEDVFQATFLVLARRASGISVAGIGGRLARGGRPPAGPGARSDADPAKSARDPDDHAWPEDRPHGTHAGTAGSCRRSFTRSPTHSSRSNEEKPGVCSTTNCCYCRRNTDRRSCFATSRAGRTKKPRASSDVPPARCHGG